MYKNQPQGWVEILFSLNKTTPSPVSGSDIKESDYLMLGSPIPLQEVDGPYDIYQMLIEGAYPNLPRPVRSFDLINVVQRGVPRLTYAIVSPNSDKKFLEALHAERKTKNKVMIWPQFPHGIIELEKPMASFCGRIGK